MENNQQHQLGTKPEDTLLQQTNYSHVLPSSHTTTQKPLTQQQQQGHFTTQSVNMSKQQTYNPQNVGVDDDEVNSDGEKDDKPKKARRRKIKIEYIKDKSKRHITFSKVNIKPFIPNSKFFFFTQ